MKLSFPLTGVFVLLLGVFPLGAATPKPTAVPGAKPSQDDTVRLQIFLDEQNFGPGKIDGRYGGFTAKSWHNYQQSQGISAVSDKFDARTFTSVDPIYAAYTVTADDLNALGTVPKDLKLQEKQKSLPYTSMAELIGERYHVGVDFLRDLNHGHDLDHLKEGDRVKVPNVVPPFNLAQVLALRQYTNERKKVLAAAKEAARNKGLTPADPASPASPVATPGGDARSDRAGLGVPAARRRRSFGGTGQPRGGGGLDPGGFLHAHVTRQPTHPACGARRQQKPRLLREHCPELPGSSPGRPDGGVFPDHAGFQFHPDAEGRVARRGKKRCCRSFAGTNPS